MVVTRRGFPADNNGADNQYKSHYKDLTWDAFQDPPRKVEIGSVASTKVIDNSVIVLKVVTYIVTFIVVLGAAVLSKGTLLFMTSQIKKNTTRYYCEPLAIYKSQQFIVTLPVEERVSWIWMLIFAYFVPELGTFVRSLRFYFFKSISNKIKISEWITLFFTEALPAVGSAILIFIVLPELDVVKGAMLTNAVCFVPGLIAFLTRDQQCNKSVLLMTMDIISLAAQAVAFVAWPLVEDKPILYNIPVSIILISVGWWQNFVSKESPYFSDYARNRLKWKNDTYYVYAFLAPIKCVIFFITTIVILSIREGEAWFLFEEFGNAFSSRNISYVEIEPIVGSGTINFDDAISLSTGLYVEPSVLTPVWVWLINVLTTYICYAFAKFSCKILIQNFSFALPINITVPVLLCILIGMSGAYNEDVCAFSGTIPSYLFYNTPTIYFFSDFVGSQYSWVWLFWLFSQTWITVHIWNPSYSDKLGSTETLFYKPMYDAFLIDQSIALNRRRNHPDNRVKDSGDESGHIAVVNDSDKGHHYTRIYACGTMWHETREEMMEFLKSVMRLDHDQFKQKKIKERFDNDEKYYELEIHVFFDDAFIRKSETDNDPLVNKFVTDLIGAVDDAAREVHTMENLKVKPPVKMITPYGGRLIWTLPGGNQMIAHLKDKAKIRPKKRWSQVMYMYYLLGHRLIERSEWTPDEKQIRANNTYILALDGDIDFQPKAVHLLVDLMKRNPTLGAACGRIHPIGSGAMAWYQTFEYAVGHWLQKATEHVIGCVLCSPGCFSLFRGGALMDDSVMKKYTTVSTEPLHYVQYDQGEDRWLCTLLLQQGYRVEYSAASDSYTHCPEGFNEFYNQRRRWMPSTTANIIDLLSDYKRTVSVNENISRPYIWYQMVNLVGTVLGPGTIFLMLIGAFVAAFKLSQWVSFGYNIIPILTFIIICATCKSDTQLFFAGIISAIYGLIMMAVVVGVLLQIRDDGWLAPSSLFFFVMAGEFIATAMLHPSEFYCLKYGVIYYVTVPSMYMLLVIYSVFNMNNVSWGTREVTVMKTDKKDEKDKGKDKAPAQKDLTHKAFSFFGANSSDDAGSIEFNFAGLFKLFCCTHKHPLHEEIIEINRTLEKLNKKLEQIEKLQLSGPEVPELRRKSGIVKLEGSRASNISNRDLSRKPLFVDDEEDDEQSLISDDSIEVEQHSWFEQEGLYHGDMKRLGKKEEVFWNQLLDKYLHPIDDSDKKDELSKKLKDLRDNMVFAFLMVNSLFVLVVFLLTLEKDTIYVPWPIQPHINFTYSTDQDMVLIYVEYLKLEPIGFVFLIFFALLLAVQFTAMLFHRFGTYTQIMANTPIYIPLCAPRENTNDDDELSLEDMQHLVSRAAVMNTKPNNAEKVERRKTIVKISKKDKNIETVSNLDEIFEKNWESNLRSEDPAIRRKTVLANRRTTIVNQKRQTLLPRRPQINSLGNGVAHMGDNPIGTLQLNDTLNDGMSEI